MFYEGNNSTVVMSDRKELNNFHCLLYCCLFLTAIKNQDVAANVIWLNMKRTFFNAGPERLLKDTDYPI